MIIWPLLTFALVALTKYVTSIRLRNLRDKIRKDRSEAERLRHLLLQSIESEEVIEKEKKGFNPEDERFSWPYCKPTQFTKRRESGGKTVDGLLVSVPPLKHIFSYFTPQQWLKSFTSNFTHRRVFFRNRPRPREVPCPLGGAGLQ